jgi:glycosyltransferase involved in cell wall biosynthesis
VPIVLTPHGILHDGDLVVDREQPLDHPLTPENLYMDAAALWSAIGSGKHPRRAFRNFLIHAPLRRYDGIFALSHHEKSIITSLGIAGQQIAVIPNSIVLTQYRTPVMRIRAEQPTLLFIGQLVPRKGWDLLVDALPTIASQVPNICVVMVTHNTSQLAALEERALRLGVRSFIDIRTNVDEAQKVILLEAAHILVAPSRYEGFGIPPIEAMAAGCAVITTDCAAGNEIVTDQQTGLLTRYNDPADLAEKILQLLICEPEVGAAAILLHNAVIAEASRTCALPLHGANMTTEAAVLLRGTKRTTSAEVREATVVEERAANHMFVPRGLRRQSIGNTKTAGLSQYQFLRRSVSTAM